MMNSKEFCGPTASEVDNEMFETETWQSERFALNIRVVHHWWLASRPSHRVVQSSAPQFAPG